MSTHVGRWFFAVSLLIASVGAGQTPSTPQSTAHGFVNVPGARLYYEIVGQGDPILVVHGGPGLDHNYLLPGMRGLATSHRVIFYDQRGSGATLGEVNASTISFDRMLADIDALVDSLRLGPITLLGHSWGGLVAMRYAARHPERLRSLILMNTVEPGQRYAERSATMMRARQSAADSTAIAAIMASDAIRRQDTSAVNALMRALFRSSFADTSLAAQLSIHLSERSASNMSRVAGLVMGPLGRDFDLWNEAASIRVPTLIVHGVDDLVPIEMPRELARTIPGARLVEIQQSGHFPYIERPREIFSAIDDFLGRSARSTEPPETVVLPTRYGRR